jgi:hypothetical protein
MLDNGLGMTVIEGAAPSGVASSDALYADSTAHRWKMNNNNGGAVQVVASGGDINISDQVTVTHLAAALPLSQGGLGIVTAPSIVLSRQAASCNNATPQNFFDLPTTNAPTATCHGTTYTWGTLDYSHSAATKSSFAFRLPIGWTGNIDVGLDWFTADNTNTDTNKWTIESACLVEGTTLATTPSFNAAQTITTNTNSTANTLTRSFQSAITTTGCAAGNILILRIGRDVTDTNTSADSLQNVDVAIRVTPQA